jgi:hypothetical protein
VTIVAWTLVVLALFPIIIGPCMIDRLRATYSAKSYLMDVVHGMLVMILAGRVIGLW